MLPVILSAILTAFPSERSGPLGHGVQQLLDTIDVLQQQVDDFQCEFEGTIRYLGKIPENVKVGENGLHESYSGLLIWKRGGGIYSDSLHQEQPGGAITRKTIVDRRSDHKEESYSRPNDARRGVATITDYEYELNMIAFPFHLFSTIHLKHDVAGLGDRVWLGDDTIDGRPLKVVSQSLKGDAQSVDARYWVDLQRGGHVVREEFYDPKGSKTFSGRTLNETLTRGRVEIKIGQFSVSGAEVWMPVSGVNTSFATGDDRNPVSKTPTVVEEARVVDGSMEFNKHPGPEVFTIRYKPGTRISDTLRKLEYEYGAQPIAARPSKAEAEKMLKDQLAQAEKQKSTLVVASTSEGFAWYAWLPWGFAALVVISLAALWIQRRGR